MSTSPPTVGHQLRTWRERRRFSQLELSHRAQVSARHLSWLETGRSRPTPEMILRLAEHLEVPLRRRDDLLLAAGYAPRHQGSAIDDAPVAAVLSGLRDLLDAHLPWPALLLDEHWDVVDANAAVGVLLAGCDPALLEPPMNALRISLHPGGLAPRIRNLEVWGRHLHQQVVHRAERTFDPRLQQLADELAGYLPVPRGDGGHGGGHSGGRGGGPVVLLELEPGLRFFSVAARVETATDATLDELHLETFLPADDATRAALSPPAAPPAAPPVPAPTV